MADTLTIFKTDNNNDEVEIPLLYNIEYAYKGADSATVIEDIAQEIYEKIGETSGPDYINSIFNDPDNNSRFSDP